MKLERPLERRLLEQSRLHATFARGWDLILDLRSLKARPIARRRRRRTPHGASQTVN
jgi:hypothetical protein